MDDFIGDHGDGGDHNNHADDHKIACDDESLEHSLVSIFFKLYDKQT